MIYLSFPYLDLASMLAFVTAVFLLIITPGPGVLSTAAVGAAFGFRAGFRYVFGLFLGTNFVTLMVIFGVAALVLANPILRVVLFGLSTAYLLYLAKNIAFAGSEIGFGKARKKPGIRDGLFLQFVNPKAYVVNSSLFAGFALFPNAYVTEVLVKLIVVNAIWIPIHLCWLWIGVKLRQFNLSPQTQKWVNWIMASSLVLVVVIAAVTAIRTGTV